jgi:hypothetical protein
MDFALDIKRLYSFFIGDIKPVLDIQDGRMTTKLCNWNKSNVLMLVSSTQGGSIIETLAYGMA